MWYIVAYTAGMFVMILVVALMEEGDNSTSSEYQKALEGQLKKANERGNELKVALDESIGAVYYYRFGWNDWHNCYRIIYAPNSANWKHVG